MEHIHLQTGSAPYDRVLIHPIVTFNILDHWIRRLDSKSRVIGALVGSIEDNVVEIRSCFPIPHTEGEQIAIHIEYYRTMFNLHSRVAPDDIVVGWYSTGSEVNEASSLIHNFFWRDMNQPPVHLLLDTDLSSGRIQVNTYHGVFISLTERGHVQQQFFPIPNEYLVQDQDRATLDLLAQSKESERTLMSDLTSLELALKRVLSMIETVSEYVDKVVNGEVPPNNEIGRFLHQTLASLPTTEANFDQMFTNGVQDVLMVVYLANLTRAHLFLAEKLRDQQALVPQV